MTRFLPGLLLLLTPGFSQLLPAFQATSPPPSRFETALEERIRSWVNAHEGEVSLAIEFLNSGKKMGIHQDRVMPTASLIKMAVMVEAYRQVHTKKKKLSRTLQLKAGDPVPGSGILTPHFQPGMTLSLRDAIQLMIACSDNTATNLVLDEVGLENVCNTMKSLGFPNTKINSKVYRGSTTSISKTGSQLYGLGSTTARESLELLKSIYQSRMISPEASRNMMQHLYSCDDHSKIARYLPAQTRIANKTGAISHARCDAAIIDHPGNPVAVVILTRQNRDRSWGANNRAEELCGRIGKALFDEVGGKEAPAARTLQPGSFGRLVEDLQRTLNRRLDPSPGLSIDGDFGPATRAAVVRFQQEKKLPAKGVVDQDDWKALGPLVTAGLPVPDPAITNGTPTKKKAADLLKGQPFVSARAWAIAELETGKILFSQNPSEVRDIASTTKIMTALLVLELAETRPDVLNEKITFSSRADKTRGSSSGIRAGEMISVANLLYGLLLPSGNDASIALAEHFGKNFAKGKNKKNASAVECFVAAMNDRAASLGMKNTHFENPHGLTSPGHQSSAEELVLLATAAMKIPRFRQYVSQRQFGCTVESVTGYRRNLAWTNTNQLLSFEGHFGIKTGTTSAAGACLVSASRRGNRDLLLVLLGSGSSRGRYVDARNLYRWAWNELEK